MAVAVVSLKSSILFLQQEAKDLLLFVLHKTLCIWNGFVGPVCLNIGYVLVRGRKHKVPSYFFFFCQEMAPHFFFFSYLP